MDRSTIVVGNPPDFVMKRGHFVYFHCVSIEITDLLCSRRISYPITDRSFQVVLSKILGLFSARLNANKTKVISSDEVEGVVEIDDGIINLRALYRLPIDLSLNNRKNLTNEFHDKLRHFFKNRLVSKK